MADSRDITMERFMLLLILGLLAFVNCEVSQRSKRFEYKLSFKGPHLVNKQGNIPFWKHFGSKFSPWF